ncbi:MAG: hypothetical protein KC464_16380, partial [Myxococcales bacterium]|nr:hypothetical protein [Myxococcales bacterium]
EPPLADRLVLRVDLGLAVDGARTSGRPTLDGQDLAAAAEADRYRSVRSYGFGEAYLGSRGVGAPSLSTYFASQARLAPSVADATPPIADVYQVARDLQVRQAWAESDGLFENRWLQPVRARAGRMYVYGPAIVHMDGLVLSWENAWLSVSSAGGTRVADYATTTDDGTDGATADDTVTSSEARLDLRHFGLPLVASAATTRYLTHDHGELAATLVPRRDWLIRSSFRYLDAQLARLRLFLRARVTESSIISVDAQYRTADDWFWDYASLAVVSDTLPAAHLDGAAQRYLDLGEVKPRFTSSIQAGTVLRQNVDLQARAAVALDVSSPETQLNPHLPDYIEGGAGVEVRVRRAINLAGSVLVRDYRRPFPDRITDVAGSQPLPLRARMGEESLVEGGASARYSGGARRFSVQGELYLRRTKWAGLYQEDAAGQAPVILLDFHGGGRFSIEAWVNPRVRLRGEYDVSSTLDLAPELRGIKSLRFFMEGTY